MMSIRGAKIPNGYRFEYDLMQEARDRINLKIEIDGEKALELALAEIGYVKEGTCQMEYGGDVTEATKRVLGVYFCSECGSPIYNDCVPYYCMYCGRKVE